MNLWTIYEKNYVEIHAIFSENLENYSISLKCIHEILESIRFYIYHFLEHQYLLKNKLDLNFNDR